VTTHNVFAIVFGKRLYRNFENHSFATVSNSVSISNVGCGVADVLTYDVWYCLINRCFQSTRWTVYNTVASQFKSRSAVQLLNIITVIIIYFCFIGHCYRLQTEVKVSKLFIGLIVLTANSVVQSGRGSSIRAGLLPWCPVQHIFLSLIFTYILLTYCLSFIIYLYCIFICVVK